MRRRLPALLRGSSGITSVEYALLLALVGATIAAAAFLLGMAVQGRINGTSVQLTE